MLLNVAAADGAGKTGNADRAGHTAITAIIATQAEQNREAITAKKSSANC